MKDKVRAGENGVPVVDIPELSMLEVFDKLTEGFRHVSYFSDESNSEVDRDRYWNQDREHGRSIASAEVIARPIVHLTIDVLAESFDLDGRYKQDMPKVVVADNKIAEKFSQGIALDAWDAPFTYYPAYSFFAPIGIRYFDHPEGPVISLFLPSVGQGSIVEESVHFLQWFYETGDVERTLRTPRFDRGYFNPPGEVGRIITKRFNGSPIVSSRFSNPSLSNLFSGKIVAEAVAEFTREMCGVNQDTADFDWFIEVDKEGLSGVPEDKKASELLETLTERGRKECYSKLFEWNDVRSFKGLLKGKHFQSMVGAFPGQIIHYLGYGLGKELATGIKTAEQVRAFSKSIFNERRNHNMKLDELIDLHQLIGYRG